MLTLRPSQVEDVQELRSRRPRALIMHEAGVGKTVVASRACEGSLPAIVAAPWYLTRQWYDHLTDEYPVSASKDRIVLASSAPRAGKRGGPSGEEKQDLIDAAVGRGFDWLIVNHEMLRKPVEKESQTLRRKRLEAEEQAELMEIAFPGYKAEQAAAGGRRSRRPRVFKLPVPRSLIIDEVHVNAATRHWSTQTWRGAYQLSTPTKSRQAAERLYLLTATPMPKDASDLFGQLALLEPRVFDSYHRFISHYCETEETAYGLIVTGAREDRVAALLRKYGIRRTYQEIGLELPPLLPPKVLSVEMTQESGAQYRNLRDDLRDSRDTSYALGGRPVHSAGAALHTFRRITADDPNKLAALTALLDREEHIIERGYIVFVWYRETAEQLRKALSKAGPPPLVVHGDVKDRAALARGSNAIIATIASLDTGVDLSHLRTVIFYEEDHLPGRMEQCLDRVRRWRGEGGDNSPVVQYYLHATLPSERVPGGAQTCDARIHRVAFDRGATIEEILAMIVEDAA